MTAYPKSSRVWWSVGGQLAPGRVITDAQSTTGQISIRLDCGLTVTALPENTWTAAELAVTR